MFNFLKKNKFNVDSEYNSNNIINDVEELKTFREIEGDKNSEPTLTKTITKDVNRRTTLFQPNAFSVIKPMVDELIQHKIILVDLSKLSEVDRKRTIDFLTGVMYSLNGEFSKIENKVYKFIVRK
ncbi:cell division protein SepF [Williamsoniiplasma somnilux]|uniref:Cell division protein SepF n=1 Tax=Williamsoniiplasma somnilux TaxID=215578 RepID=A0A2K8NXZ0_9MOLU|nr:cell division protein SepF [Williamsoniiplasma somnilux]ATZ18657.1 cell division protein SepF [Williamsoniiplasma somnilux]